MAEMLVEEGAHVVILDLQTAVAVDGPCQAGRCSQNPGVTGQGQIRETEVSGSLDEQQVGPAVRLPEKQPVGRFVYGAGVVMMHKEERFFQRFAQHVSDLQSIQVNAGLASLFDQAGLPGGRTTERVPHHADLFQVQFLPEDRVGTVDLLQPVDDERDIRDPYLQTLHRFGTLVHQLPDNEPQFILFFGIVDFPLQGIGALSFPASLYEFRVHDGKDRQTAVWADKMRSFKGMTDTDGDIAVTGQFLHQNRIRTHTRAIGMRKKDNWVLRFSVGDFSADIRMGVYARHRFEKVGRQGRMRGQLGFSLRGFFEVGSPFQAGCVLRRIPDFNGYFAEIVLRRSKTFRAIPIDEGIPDRPGRIETGRRWKLDTGIRGISDDIYQQQSK